MNQKVTKMLGGIFLGHMTTCYDVINAPWSKNIYLEILKKRLVLLHRARKIMQK